MTIEAATELDWLWVECDADSELTTRESDLEDISEEIALVEVVVTVVDPFSRLNSLKA